MTLQFTGKERDAETGLDYFEARYFSAAQGRFTSPDEFTGGAVDPFTGGQVGVPGPLPYADVTNPQSLNKYSYVLNNPLRYFDPDGHDPADTVLDLAIEEIDKVTRPLINSAYEGVATGGKMAARGVGMVVAVPLLLLTTPAQLGGTSEVEWERQNMEKIMRDQQQPVPPGATMPGQSGQPGQQPGQPARTSPAPQNAEHTKNKNEWDKHTKTRSGDKQPPNYATDRECVQPKPPKTNKPASPKAHRNKYKKENKDGSS